MPLYLRPQSDDIARGLLLFGGEPRPYGSAGLRALSIQLANDWGFDKAPLNARADWAVQRHEQFKQWARDPLGDDGWMDADKPIQFLASCMALAYPEEIGARLPGRLDGSPMVSPTWLRSHGVKRQGRLRTSYHLPLMTTQKMDTETSVETLQKSCGAMQRPANVEPCWSSRSWKTKTRHGSARSVHS